MIEDFTQLADLKARGVPFVIATVVRAERPTSAKAGDKAIVTRDGLIEGWVGGSCAEPTVVEEAKAALADGECRLIHISPDAERPASREGLRFFPMTCYSGGTLEIYIEPHLAAPRLLVFGRSPVASALVELGRALKYRVALVREMGELPSDRSGPLFAVVATHGVFDEEALLSASRMEPAYLGLVASRRRAQAVKSTLLSMGTSEAEVARIQTPAGMEIGAVAPEEIALSVLAEIVRVRRNAPAVAREHEHAEPAPVARLPVASSCCHAAAPVETIEAVMLAAGQSTRMGKNKLLLPVDGVPLVRRTAQTLLAAGFEKVIAVLGFEAEKVRAALEGLPLELVVNERYAEGQPTSARAGIEAVSSDATGVMICLSDQPHLTADDLLEIKQAFLARSSGSVLVPMYQGQRGNPIVLDRHGVQTILERGGNFACRHFTTHHSDLVVPYEMKTDHVIKDLDHPEDYAALTA